ncbi:hypothetical protein LWF01_03940 [Saxibacter everestensis]|uniref:Uncharacterized protein n=1 Tax=Saxibacter everestensis TaxID=2909229 RepID=A0ABY8QV77_9MICO|nr:hypothetical protein LWF01_03940 [Brevibacteriaceae bacterium ZFBP1038]
MHTGHIRSFVYDIADLYKADLTIPLAFDLASKEIEDLGRAARLALRDKFHGSAFLNQCVKDIRHLLLPDDEVQDSDDLGHDVVQLWDGSQRSVAAGTSYDVDF